MMFRGRKLGMPRLRVRTLMALVAVVALGIEGTREGLRWSRYRELARHSREAERESRKDIEESEREAAEVGRMMQGISFSAEEAASMRDQMKQIRESIDEMRLMADWLAVLARKYEEAQRRPWREAPPDPLPPESPSIASGGRP